MRRRTTWAVSVAAAALVALTGCSTSGSSASSSSPAVSGSGSQAASTGSYYWINHGSASDPFWVGAAKGATQAGQDLGVDVKQSFSNGDVSAEVEAVNAAIAANAAGIAVSSPKDGALKEVIAKATAANIPVVMFNTDDPSTSRLAYVGANLRQAGVTWAQYLVDNKLVKSGDYVWMPVEVPGATYQTEEESGVKSVFDPLNIKAEVFNASGDPAKSLSNMTDYLTANASKVNAVIGMGDLVMGNIQKAFTTAGIKPGQIPVVGWGNTNATATAVVAGYVNAGLWQYPDSQGYLPIALLKMHNSGMAIGFDVPTTALYDKTNAETYVKLTAAK